MIITVPEGLTGSVVAQRMMWLAYQAAQVVGMGALQARRGMTEDDVWEATSGTFEVYGDYVFGKMMKLNIKFRVPHVEVPDMLPHPDYQSWCRQYPTYQALFEAAVLDLQTEPK